MEKLKNLRKEHNLSQSGLAKLLKISQNQVSKYEKGTNFPGIKVLFKIAEVFEIPLESLIDKKAGNIPSEIREISTVELGKKIKIFRKKHNLSQHGLAKLLKISSSQVSKYEKGTDFPGIKVLFKIAEVSDITLDYLIDDRDVGEKIREIRLFREQTQAELGKMVGLTDDRIRQYENNVRKPKNDMLQKFAMALNVDVSAISAVNVTIDDFMQLLIFLENKGVVSLKKINDQYMIAFDSKNQTIQKSLNTWYTARQEKTGSDYKEWCYQYHTE